MLDDPKGLSKEAQFVLMFEGAMSCYIDSPKLARRDRIGWWALWDLKKADPEKFKEFTMEQARDIWFPEESDEKEPEGIYEEEMWDGGEEKRILRDLKDVNRFLSSETLEDDEETDLEEGEGEEENKGEDSGSDIIMDLGGSEEEQEEEDDDDEDERQDEDDEEEEEWWECSSDRVDISD